MEERLITLTVVFSSLYGIGLCFKLSRSERCRVKMAEEAREAGLPMNMGEYYQQVYKRRSEQIRLTQPLPGEKGE